MSERWRRPRIGGFAYSEKWLDNGFAISPFSLPVEQKVFVPTSQAFSGLWGVFANSLPDAWGQLLVDRMLKAREILSADMTQLERLTIVGDSGMGALSYRPAWNIQQDAAIGDLDELSAQCHAILNHEDAGDLDELFQMGGSSGGARPKIMTDEWIIKFPASDEMKDSGTMEKAYMDCAAGCGIIVPETKLMPSDVCAGYFAVKRFDRRKTDGHIERQHMLTAAAILEVDWRTAAMDYHKHYAEMEDGQVTLGLDYHTMIVNAQTGEFMNPADLKDNLLKCPDIITWNDITR